MRRSYALVAVLALGLLPWDASRADDDSASERQGGAADGTACDGFTGLEIAEAEAFPVDVSGSPSGPEPVHVDVRCCDGGVCGCDNGGADGAPCCCRCCCAAPWRLLQFPAFCGQRIELGGWVDQGVAVNGRSPVNRFNGPVVFNDRSNEYQMNQLYLFAERAAKTGGCGWDIGGRVDLLYGTDHRFTVANGLEDAWNTGQRFYGLALPQAYVDVAYNDLTFRGGHFYSLLGYESVMAPENFFSSHSYTMQYGAPRTHTGMVVIYQVNDGWSVAGGFDRGWDNWEDNNDCLNFIGRAMWTSCDGRTSLSVGLTTGDEDDAGSNNRTAYSVVFTRQLTCRWKWVLEHTAGWEENVTTQLGVADAEWYGLTNYLFYTINPCWSLGLRYEWFADDDGARIDHRNAAGGPPKGMFYNGVPYHWNGLTLGVNWTPHRNITLRSELRGDWLSLVGNTVPGDGPFNDYRDRDQFLWTTDLIVQF